MKPEKNRIRPGTLYLVGTPIGNLEDLTFRALKVLREADLVAAEDTRVTGKLLAHLGIGGKRLLSCHGHNEQARVPEILEALGRGEAVALVCDAGTPVVSDPGEAVVRAVLEAGFPVVPIPGASAVLAALASSGLPGVPFTFVGFLPARGEERRRELVRLRSEERTLVFFEAPHRLRESFKDMMNVFGNRRAVAARELTKLHEEFIRGTLQELWQHFKAGAPRGEFTVVVEGAERRGESGPERFAGVSIAAQLRQLMEENGLSKTEAVKAVCRLRALPREVVYRIAQELPPPSRGREEG